MTERYDFGSNWAQFIAENFSVERAEAARKNLLDFLGRPDLKGLTFLDIGSGSGLHSLAAYHSGAAQLRSFDYNEHSVATTAKLKSFANDPQTWVVERGDVLDQEYMDGLGHWDIVYSWGVLHHTGSMWAAIENASMRVKPNGLFFIALYSSNVAEPSTEFWLDIKRKYNAADAAGKRRMEYWYLWRFGIDRNPLRIPKLLKQMYDRKKLRGMSYMVDVRDWLGGWPMEYADDQDVIDRLEGDFGFELLKISTGEACTEFLFKQTGLKGLKSNAREIALKQKELKV